jgi:hypothetical protein
VSQNKLLNAEIASFVGQFCNCMYLMTDFVMCFRYDANEGFVNQFIFKQRNSIRHRSFFAPKLDQDLLATRPDMEINEGD